jgi:hypothetical protein
MAFTYDLSTDRGEVRFLIPDTNEDSYELQDAEIDWFLTARGNNVNWAAVDACRWLARKYSQQANWSADGVQWSGATRAEQYAKRADELTAALSGGISSVTLTRSDGFSEEATDGEYPRKTIYIRTR